MFALVLATRRSNALAFLVGWFAALAFLFGVAFVALGGSDMGSASTGQRTWTSVSILLIGGGLLVVAVHRWTRPDEPGSRPLLSDSLLRRLDRLGPRRAGGIGVLIQPRTLTIAAALVVARDRSGSLEMLVGLTVFGVASSSVLIGLLAYEVTNSDTADVRLARFVDMLERNSRQLITIGSAAAGAFLVVDAMYGLIG